MHMDANLTAQLSIDASGGHKIPDTLFGFFFELGDFGLARWKTDDDPVYTRLPGILGYLAPEYTENGVVSVRTDVYAFGIILLQLISRRRVIGEKRSEGQQTLQWAEPLIEICNA